MSKKKFLAIYAKSFNWAGAFLPKEIYEDCSSLYNFCRSVDDIADCDDKLSVKVQKMNTFIDSFNSKNCGDEIILDMKRLIIKYNISDKIIFDLFDGVKTDLVERLELLSEKEIFLYSYRVAGTVGLMMAKILRVNDRAALIGAIDLGIAMQLTNILRDVQEDAARDRIYLPMEDLERYGITEEDIMSGEKLLEHPGWKPFVEEYSQRVASYRDKGFKLLPLIPKQSRYSPAAMMAFYSSILRRIVKTGGDVFTERVKLSKAEKLTLAAGVYLRHRFFSF